MIAKLSYLDRIKLLMMLMMTTGHLAWVFVPEETQLSEWLHFFARSTVVLACFLVVQGVRLSRDLMGYSRRLFGFGVLAQVPFIMMAVGVWRIFYDPMVLFLAGNVLFTLGACLMAVITYQKMCGSQSLWFKLYYALIIIVLMALSEWFSLDWGAVAIVWALAIYVGGAQGFVWATLTLIGLSRLVTVDSLDATFSGRLMDYGIILAWPVMLWYERYKERSPTNYRLPRTLFYWYYVLHALIIGILVQYSPYALDNGVLVDAVGTPIDRQGLAHHN